MHTQIRRLGAGSLTLGVYLVLGLYTVITVFPMVWVAYSSLKDSRSVFLEPFSPPGWGEVTWSNYERAWTHGSFGSYFANSVVITGITVVLTLLLGSMAGYALARFVFAGGRAIWLLFLAGLIVPVQLAIVPLFFELKALGLLNLRTGLIGVYTAVHLPFAVVILTGFFKTLPISLYESALLDGCGEFHAFWYVMLPLARTGLLAVAVFVFLGVWNEYLMAFMFLSGHGSESRQTLPLGMAQITTVGEFQTDWGLVFAGMMVMILPCLFVYVVLQRYLTRGVTLGAITG